MSNILPVRETRNVLVESLPNIEPNRINAETIPYTYVPLSHERALSRDAVLVEGIRGSGKSFWWNALANDVHRQFIFHAFPDIDYEKNVTVHQGFGMFPDEEKYPSKDLIRKIIECGISARSIWRAVIAKNLKFEFPISNIFSWQDASCWAAENPEILDRAVKKIDETAETTVLILFDALDRLAQDWKSLRPIARDLFQLSLDMKSYKNIRLKLFVRPDMINDPEIFNFPDASKLKAQKALLKWNVADLYSLLFQCVGNHKSSGNIIREISELKFSAKWSEGRLENSWIIPKILCHDENLQKEMFHMISGPAMARGQSGHKRGIPYTWLPNHLADKDGNISPRSFMTAIRVAAQYRELENWNYPISFSGLYDGVRKASEIRVNEIKEEYLWIETAMGPLKSISVPCSVDDFINRWKEHNTIESLKLRTYDDSLPPQYLEQGEKGLLNDLVELNIIDIISSNRIQMPDLYRIAFGLGRRGGVRPLQRKI